MRNPSVFGPPCRIRDAKTGISTVYGIPIRLTRPSISKSERMAFDRRTYCHPSVNSCQARRRRGGDGRAETRIATSDAITAR